MSLFDTLPFLRVLCGFCTFILVVPELRVFRGSILQVLPTGTRSNLGGYCQHWQYSGVCTADMWYYRPVLAVSWEDIASTGNILGYVLQICLLLPLWAVLFV